MSGQFLFFLTWWVRCLDEPSVHHVQADQSDFYYCQLSQVATDWGFLLVRGANILPATSATLCGSKLSSKPAGIKAIFSTQGKKKDVACPLFIVKMSSSSHHTAAAAASTPAAPPLSRLCLLLGLLRAVCSSFSLLSSQLKGNWLVRLIENVFFWMSKILVVKF